MNNEELQRVLDDRGPGKPVAIYTTGNYQHLLRAVSNLGSIFTFCELPLRSSDFEPFDAGQYALRQSGVSIDPPSALRCEHCLLKHNASTDEVAP